MAGGINHYVYANLNPINVIDPFGLDPAVRWKTKYYSRMKCSGGNCQSYYYRQIKLYDNKGYRSSFDVFDSDPWYSRENFAGIEVDRDKFGDWIYNFLIANYVDYDFNERCEAAGDYLRSDSVKEKFDTFSAWAQASPTQFVGIDYAIQNWEGGSESSAMILRTYTGAIKSVIKRK